MLKEKFHEYTLKKCIMGPTVRNKDLPVLYDGSEFKLS